MANDLSEKARLVLLHVFRKFRENPGPIPDYATLAAELPLSITDIDEAAIELSLSGHVQVVRVMGDCGNGGIYIQDKGKVVAANLRDTAMRHVPQSDDAGNEPSRSGRVGRWLLDHVVAEVVVAVIVALVLVWIGIGQ